jgi:hypothetical protein
VPGSHRAAGVPPAAHVTKGKVIRVLNEAPCHEDVGGSGGIAYEVLTLILDGGDWPASRCGRFIPMETVLGTHWIHAEWAPGPVLTQWRRGNIPVRAGNRTPVVQPVA